jgi:hypothetical protein
VILLRKQKVSEQMRKVLLLSAIVLAFGAEPASAQAPMKFFVTGTKGPDASGERGIQAADDHCAQLGYGAGYGDFVWRAFLTTGAGQNTRDNVRERIGEGPWYNFEGVPVASNVDELLSGNNYLNRQTALNQQGFAVYARQGSPEPREVLASGKPDANGLYFCFAQ